jgi:ATP-binding cassette, subfamily B, bacterial
MRMSHPHPTRKEDVKRAGPGHDRPQPRRADTTPLPPPAKRWLIPALIGYAFKESPAVTTLTAVTAILACAAPVGITIAIGELVNLLTSAIGHGLDTPAAHDCYRWIALIVVLFFLTHLADSARTALGQALGRRVTGRLGERVMMAASEPATIGHLEDAAYLSRLGQARGAGPIEMAPGERSSASPPGPRRG